jgi:hypothetical protein
MPNPLGPGGPGFYGATYAPFTIDADPVQPDFQVRDLNVAKGVDDARLELRKRLISEAERIGAGKSFTGRAKTMKTFYEKALELVTSPQAKEAFRIQKEPAKLREQYGHTSIGQCCLLARRLVESGCRFIGIDHGSWDTHVDNFTSHEKALAPPTDQALSALLIDLDDRGLLDETLVVMMGEMGRTPRINANAGRDHWSQCQTVIMAGGGAPRGTVVGASDKTASYPTTEPIGIADLLRTVFHLMGIDASKIYYTPVGRPVPIVSGGKVVNELIA